MLKQCLFIAGVLASTSVLAQFAPKLGTSTPSSDGASAEGGATDGESALKSYVGFDYVTGQLASSVGASASTTHDTFDFDMLRVRGGMRFFEMLAIELQYGTSIGGADANQAEIDSYASALLVPTATVFDTIELSFPVGVTKIEAKQGGRIFEDTDISYGLQSELPLRQFADLPDLRLGAGFMVYHAGNASRTYGFNLGLRYDFDLGEIEFINPITAVSELFGGGDDSAGEGSAGDAGSGGEAPAEAVPASQ